MRSRGTFTRILKRNMDADMAYPSPREARSQEECAVASSWAARKVLRRRLPPIFVVGYPSDLGGADTECWRTTRLWRQLGLEVNFIPTWRPKAKWHARLTEIGCQTIRCGLASLAAVAREYRYDRHARAENPPPGGFAPLAAWKSGPFFLKSRRARPMVE